MGAQKYCRENEQENHHEQSGNGEQNLIAPELHFQLFGHFKNTPRLRHWCLLRAIDILKVVWFFLHGDPYCTV